jgi:hypothetical protein
VKSLPEVDWTFPKSAEEATLLNREELEAHYVMAVYNRCSDDAARIGTWIDGIAVRTGS